MVRTKNTDRRVYRQGQRARFRVHTGTAARRHHYQQKLRLQINQIPSDDESSPLHESDWQSLEPSLPGGISPKVEKVVDRMNAVCPIPAVPSPTHQTIGELLMSLNVQEEASPEETPSAPAVPIEANIIMASPARTEETLSFLQSSAVDNLIEDLPIPSPTETVLYDENGRLSPTVTAETVEEFSIPVMAESVLAKPTPSSETVVTQIARPCSSTAAVKCPRKQYRPRKVQRAEPSPRRRRPQLSALQEIRKWQTRVDPLLPLHLLQCWLER